MASNRAALSPSDVDALVDYVYLLAMAHPLATREATEDEKLLKDAGFIDLRGTDPPALLLFDSAGKQQKLSDLIGRLVLIHFWGTNCTHCLKEMPSLKMLEGSFAGRPFSVLHVCVDADVQEAQLVADGAIPGQRVFIEETGLGLARFEVQALPMVWLIAPDGKAIGRMHGSRDWGAANVRRLIERWLPAVGVR